MLNDLRSEAEQKKFCYHLVEEVPGLVAISLQNTLVPPSSTDVIELSSIKNMPCILIADKNSQEQEKLFYRCILNFNGNFLIAKDLPSALAMLINNEGFMPISSNSSVSNFIGEFSRLAQLYDNGEPIHFKYCAFWNKNADTKLLEPIMQKLAQAYLDVLATTPTNWTPWVCALLTRKRMSLAVYNSLPALCLSSSCWLLQSTLLCLLLLPAPYCLTVL
nr:hypothetical protein [uncultured Phascolarctobacterium sp.]